MIQSSIRELVRYGLATGLIEPEDTIYTTNRLLELFGLDELEDADTPITADKSEEPELVAKLESILKDMLDYAAENGLLENNSVVYRDLFDTKIMSTLVARPSEIIRTFRAHYANSPQEATDYFYKFSQDTDYIRRYRVCRDQKWVAHTKYGDLDITINLSKPEKDPKAIAAARNAKQSAYPKCQLCMENEGYAGRVNHPARQNHRIIPITINNSAWGFQYSPYVYYNEHCIVFNSKHIPMKIEHDTFVKLFDFVKLFPHYMLGSNADLPIVGGSILTHDHYQGGRYTFPMFLAKEVTSLSFAGYEDIKASHLYWPLSVIRLKGSDKKRLIDLSCKIIDKWRNYTDESRNVLAYTDVVPHNTVTPIVHREEKENIGLIEVMGLAVLPSRLKGEMEKMTEHLLKGEDIAQDEDTKKHAQWLSSFRVDYPKTMAKEEIEAMLETEIGKTFMKVLECAGVYKQDEEGRKGLLRFVEFVNSR